MNTPVNFFLRKMLKWLSFINSWICLTMRNFAGLLLIAMTSIVTLQILSRYVFNNSLIWTEEVSKTMMVWCAFLIAPWAYRNGANVSISIFVNELPLTLRQSLRLLINILVIWIIIVFFLESHGMVDRGFLIQAASLPIQVGWFYIVIPLTFLVMIFVGIELLARDVLSFFYPKENFKIVNTTKNLESEN